MTRETRNVDVEFRVEETPSTDGPVKTIVGYAATYGQRSDPIGGRFVEVIDPGTFRKALQRTPDVRALIDHEPTKILGRTTSGTLRLAEDDKGLRVEIDVPDTTYGRDIVESVRRGDINGMSFGFRTIEDDWDNTENPPLRTLKDVDLDDVSIVTYPAYPNTEVALRHLDSISDPDFEKDYIKILNSMS